MMVMVRALIGAHRGSRHWQSIGGFGNGLCLSGRCWRKVVVLILSIFCLEVAGNAHRDVLVGRLDTAGLGSFHAFDEQGRCMGSADDLHSTGLEDLVVEDSYFGGRAGNRHSQVVGHGTAVFAHPSFPAGGHRAMLIEEIHDVMMRESIGENCYTGVEYLHEVALVALSGHHRA